MLEDPFHHGERAERKPRPVRLAWFLWAAAIVLILGATAFLSSCASTPLPACEKFEYSVIEDRDGEQCMTLDSENVKKLVAMLYGLHEGKCRLVPKGAT